MQHRENRLCQSGSSDYGLSHSWPGYALNVSNTIQIESAQLQKLTAISFTLSLLTLVQSNSF